MGEATSPGASSSDHQRRRDSVTYGGASSPASSPRRYRSPSPSREHDARSEQHSDPPQKSHQPGRPTIKTSASSMSVAASANGDESMHDERRKSTSDDKKPPKRPREQYSCVECSLRTSAVGARQRLWWHSGPWDCTDRQDPITVACGAQRAQEGQARGQRLDDRKVDDLARTTARIARLERILTVQDPTYVEQRLALAEKAIRVHLGEDDGPRASTSYRTRAELSRSSSYAQEDNEQDRAGEEHLDDNEGFLGTSALEAVRLAPQLQDTNGRASAGRSPQDLLSYIQPSATRRGFPIPLADVHAIRATLPSREQCDRYFDAFFANYNWSRSPILGSTVRERYRQLFSSVPTPSAIRVDADTLPLVALILSTLTLGSVPPAVQPLSSATSHAFFWATKKALVLCETLGLASLDSCWAHGILVRYLDVIRVTRASWHEIGSWIRDALDLGLHRDGSSFRLPKEQVAARRTLWWHVLHNDREWSILLGRPLTITFHTTEMPTREDLEPLGFACQTYLLARNRFTACLEAITHCFQERSAPQGGRASRSYFKVLEVDDMIAEFVDSLPPYLAPNATTKSGKSKIDTSLDEHHPLLPYYRHLINSEVCFYRSLLHRPYLLRPAVNGKHPYPESRRICVETALNDLRARKEYAAKLTREETAQTFGGAYAMFNSAIVVGLSLLTAFGLGEKIEHSDLIERLGYLQDYITQLRRNFEAGNVDASAEKERMVMEVLLSRLDPILPDDIVKSSRGELAAAAQGSIQAASRRNSRSAGAGMAAMSTIDGQGDDEQQALDSLRMLSGTAPSSASASGAALGSHAAPIDEARFPLQQLGGIRSMMATPLFAQNEAGGTPSFASLASMGMGAGGAPGNPIDPYGWLLTPSGVSGTDEFASVGTARSTPSRTDSTSVGHGGGSSMRSGGGGGGGGDKRKDANGTGSGFVTSASTPSNALHHRTDSAEGQAPHQLHQHGAAANNHLPFNGEHDPHFDWEAILQTIGSGWVGDAMMESAIDGLDR
ncbi:uncharacterized protein PSFLO_00699 [Pseudozyma flocculosa]|uniref:Xylanolytic transcriptional activator regulatory domain-containing protein n=1 Tax=Pseudozyma flocculosa TaxID=84751 RepID=A0A5C3ESK1_9BASI|nr:uncharacterized protein PSFLO_00699 [Pseudozyma flocculosa]